MGERGAKGEDADPATDIAEMGRLAAEGVEAGFLGFTTSRTQNHKTSLGEPTPTLTAARDELVGIAEAIGTTGHRRAAAGERLRRHRRRVRDRASHDRVVGPADQLHARRVAPRLRVPPGDPRTTSRRHGPTASPSPVRPRSVRSACCSASSARSTRSSINPVYREIADLPQAERTAALRDPAFRERLLAAAGGKDMQAVGGRLIEKFDIMFALGESPNYEPEPGRLDGGASPLARVERPPRSRSTRCSRTTAPRCCGYRSPTSGRATSTARTSCSPTPTPFRRCPTAARTSARSATARSRPRCCSTGAAIATASGSISSS